MISIICLICKKEFLVKPYRAKLAKFCSFKCYGISKKGIHPKMEIKKGQHLSFKTEFKKGKLHPNFGKPSGAKGKHWKFTKEQRIALRGRGKGIKRPYSIPPHPKGKNHWNWKGGITPVNILIRQSNEYKNWQQIVYKKYHWTCQICKKHCNKDIVAHHILDFHRFIEQRFLINNGIVLCRKCHINLHRTLNRLSKMDCQINFQRTLMGLKI